MKSQKRYEPGLCSHDISNKLAIHGPGDGFGYHAGYLNSDILFDNTDEGRALAERVCGLLERAYRAGSQDRLRSIQAALGVS